MKEYIDRAALIEEINHQKRAAKTSYPKQSFVVGDVLTCIYNAPAADVVECKRGNWCWITEDIYTCDNCGETSHVKEVMCKPDWDWCPNCGADMRGNNHETD